MAFIASRRLVWLVILSAFLAQAQKNLDIFLLIGQSNMAGRGPMLSKDTALITGAYLFKDSSTWEPARNPLNKYSMTSNGVPDEIGPGFGFAAEMHQLLPQTSFGLIVNAVGGTSIKLWVKGASDKDGISYYAESIKRARQAKKSGKLRGILWHQGESDAGDSTYLVKLQGLIDSLRKDLGDPELPFVAGQIGTFRPSNSGFNTRILKLPEMVPQTSVVLSDSLNHKGDSTHFDRSSQIVLGHRYAAAAWTLVYNNGTVVLRNPRNPRRVEAMSCFWKNESMPFSWQVKNPSSRGISNVLGEKVGLAP